MSTYIQKIEFDDLNGLTVEEIFIVADERTEAVFQTEPLGNSIYFSNGMSGTPELILSGTYTGDEARTYTVRITSLATENCSFADNGDGRTRLNVTTGTTQGDTIWFYDAVGDYYKGFHEVLEVGPGNAYIVIGKAYVATGGASFRYMTFEWQNGDGNWDILNHLDSSGTAELEDGIIISFTEGYANINVPNAGVYDYWTFSTAIIVAYDVIAYDGLTEEDDDESGEIMLDDLSFKINQAALMGSQEIAMANFIADTTDKTKKRYIALFEHIAGQPLDIDADSKYLGFIQPEVPWDGITHLTKELWTSVPNPLTVLSFNAIPIANAIIEPIKLYDICKRVNEDTAWVTANVSNKPGHYENINLDWRATYDSIINLNVGLKKIADTLSEMIEEGGWGKLEFTWATSFHDGKIVPARYNHMVDLDGEGWPYVDFNHTEIGDSYVTKAYPNERAIIRDTSDDTDIRALQIGDPTNDYTSPHVSYRLFWNTWPVKSTKDLQDEYNIAHINFDPIEAESFCWYNMEGIESFTDLLYGIGETYGFIPKITNPTPITINIEFIKRSNLGSEEVHIIGALSDSLDTAPVDEEKVQKYKIGDSFGLATEQMHYNRYILGVTGDLYNVIASTYIRNRDESMSIDEKNIINDLDWDEYKKVAFPLTISPTICRMEYIQDSNHVWYKPVYCEANNYQIPHNIVVEKISTGVKNYNPSPWTTYNVHTGIYMKVSPYGTDVPGEPTSDYFTPAKAWIIRKDNEDNIFYNVASAAYYFKNLRNKNYATDRTLLIPGLTGFSLNSDGSNPGPNIVKLWQKLVLDNINYIIAKIDTNGAREVTITLRNMSEYAYSNPLLDTEMSGLISSFNPAKKKSNVITGIAINDITAGTFVSDKPPTATTAKGLEPSKSISSQYGAIKGIALNSALTGGSVQVQFSGDYTNENWALVPNNRYFIRTVTDGEFNISNIPPPSNTEENLLVDIGYAIDETTLRIEISTGSISG